MDGEKYIYIFEIIANYRLEIEGTRFNAISSKARLVECFPLRTFSIYPGVKKSRKYSFRGFTPAEPVFTKFLGRCDGRVPRFILAEEDFVNNASATSSPLDGLFTRSANYFVRKLVYFARGNRSVRPC